MNAAERRKLIEERLDTVRRVWRMGRSDRVAGYPPAIAWTDDTYYMAGYNDERRREVLPVTTDKRVLP